MFVKHKSRPAAKALDIFPSGWYILSVFGEMSERFKEPVLKTGDAAMRRGFESHSLRQISIFAEVPKWPKGLPC